MKISAYSTQYEKLRAWMRQRREDSGLSLRAASVEMDRHHSVIGKMEQYRRRIDILEFVEYCHVVGADPHEGLQLIIDSMNKPMK